MPARALLLVTLALAAACSSAPRIGVNSSVSSQAVSAAQLAARVKTALLNDSVVGLRRIDVHATGTDIRLTGRVASEAERDRALQIARGVEGVGNVTSALDIRP